MKRNFSPIPVLTLLIVCGLFAFAASLVSCTRQKTPGEAGKSPAAAASGGGIAQGHPSLAFDYRAATELLISKNDPFANDRWTSRIVRQADGSWQIALGPNGQNLIDRRANAGFILHLLDTVRTLQLKEVPLSGTPESFGLAPPRFSLRWRVSDEKSYEIRLGAPAKDPDGKFAGLYGSVLASANSSPPPVDRVFTMQGALLKMLEILETFDTLRQQTLATFEADDIDELTLYNGPRKVLYAQREGEQWTDATHKPIIQDMGAFLRAITHHRVEKFIDNSQQSLKLLRKIQTQPLYRIIFKTRQGEATSLHLRSEGGEFWATISSRTSGDTPAVFGVYSELIASIQPLLRRP